MPEVRPTTIDFESFGIEGRPDYPPKPVGVAIKPWGKPAKYWSWAHVTGGNNCTFPQAAQALKQVWDCKDGLLFHNAKFDVDVAESIGFKPRPWDKLHDTLLLLFLDDPNQSMMSLKPSAERLLGMKPEERDAVRDWLLKHQPVPNVKISASSESEHYFARYIAYAPGTVVGPYAIGDVVRTEKLFDLLHPKTMERGMRGAYDRERQLMPILLATERQGVRVDLKRLKKDIATYDDAMAQAEAWVFKTLKCAPFKISSGAELVKALVRVNKIDLKKLGVTPKSGKPKTDKESLKAAVTDLTLLTMLQYRGKLKSALEDMKPWAATATKSGGLIFTNWYQTKGNDGGGTRTGRLSSSPNFQNIPKEFKPLWSHELKGLPRAPIQLPSLPLCRGYVIPSDPGHILIGRDFSQQEPRILAHFEGGNLLSQYQADPWIDFHDNAKEKLEEAFNRKFERKVVKNINLGLIYGMGIGKMAVQNNATVEETKAVKAAILAMYPGLKEMYQIMRARAMRNEHITTWGGRQYFVEPPRIVEGHMRAFDYKLVNTLIQGSAADCTKEAIIRFWATKVKGHKLLMSVHDEIVVSVPKKDAKGAMETLRKAMESVEFDVKILSEGYTGMNWGDLKDYDKKGVAV